MALGSCPRCGSKDGGFFKLCGSCEHTVNMLRNLDSKNKVRPIGDSEDDE